MLCHSIVVLNVVEVLLDKLLKVCDLVPGLLADLGDGFAAVAEAAGVAGLPAARGGVAALAAAAPGPLTAVIAGAAGPLAAVSAAAGPEGAAASLLRKGFVPRRDGMIAWSSGGVVPQAEGFSSLDSVWLQAPVHRFPLGLEPCAELLLGRGRNAYPCARPPHHPVLSVLAGQDVGRRVTGLQGPQRRPSLDGRRRRDGLQDVVDGG